MKNKIFYNNIVLLVIMFCIILLLQLIFNLEDSFILMLMIYGITAVLTPKWVKDNDMEIKYKIILCLILFLMSSITLFLNFNFEQIKGYFVWFGVIFIFSFIGNSIYKSIKSPK